MTDYITNKDTRALNKYPPDGADMGLVRKGTTITATGKSSDGKYTGYKLPDGKFRCVPTVDLDAVGVTPPPIDPPPVVVENFSPPAELMARWMLEDGTYTPYYFYKIVS